MSHVLMREVALDKGAAKFVRGGGRDVQSKQACAAGEQLRLVDERGDELGLAIGDPDNAKLRVMCVPADGFAAIDGALLGWRVERALAWRRQLQLVGPEGDDRAYRLVHGAGDGLPGFSCDVLGRVAVVYVYGAGLRALGKQLGEAIVGFARLDGAVIKLRGKDGAEDLEVIGKVEPAHVAVEGEARFAVHPLGSLNTGLFTDMREHRRGLSRYAADRDVLNLFSYTGALSIACARAGAKTVTSVDTSDGVQQWARANFTLNQLADAARWRFETGDAVRFLGRAARDRERYQLVIIDPPTFSTARGAPWSIERDYPALIAQAAAVVPPDGVLWLAANSYELAAGALGKLALDGVRAADRTGAIVEQGGLPPEYPTLAAQPRDRYLQVCVVRLH